MANEHYNKSLTNIIKNNVLIILKDRGLKQADMSEISGLSKSSVSRLLSNSEYDPRLSTLEQVANALQVSLTDLMNPDFKKLKSSEHFLMLSAPIIDWDIIKQYKPTQAISDYINTNSSDTEWAFFEKKTNIHISENIFALFSLPSMYPFIPKHSTLIFDPHRAPKDGQRALIKFRDTNDVGIKQIYIDPPHTLFSSLSNTEKTVYDANKHQILATLININYTDTI